MQLPFTAEQFFEVIRHYNQAVWPAQVLLHLLAGVALLLLVRWRRPGSARAVWGVLALLWAWSGVAYHLAFFAAINPAAYAFAALFLAGAVQFAWYAVGPGGPTFALAPDLRTAVAAALIGYALVVYPLWSSLDGHPYPSLPTFGLPCPTTIFTIGVLALARGGPSLRLVLAPVLWALVGVQAAFLLGVTPDLGLGAAGLVAVALAVASRRRPKPLAHA